MLISSKSPKKRQLFANSFLYIVYLADVEEISILYWGIKKMVKSQTVQSINK